MNRQRRDVILCIVVAVVGMFLNWRSENTLNFEGVQKEIKYDGPWFTFLFFYFIILILSLIGDRSNTIIYRKAITTIASIVLLIGLFSMVFDIDNKQYSFFSYFIETIPAYLIILLLNERIIKWILLSSVILLLVLTLPFHYVLSKDKILLKDNLSFNNTFISENDIDNLTNRYNSASFSEKLSIRNEPLVRKFMQEGILKETTK